MLPSVEIDSSRFLFSLRNPRHFPCEVSVRTTEPGAAVDIEAICSPTAYEDAAPAWRDVWAHLSERTPFLSLEWHAAWWHALGDGTPEIVVVRDGGSAAAIAPLVRRANGSVWFSGDEETDVLGVVGDSSAASEAVARYLAREARAIDLRYVPAGAPLLEVAPRVLREAGWNVDLAPLVVSPRVSLPATFDAYLASLSKKDRHELRRKLRKLEESGRVSFSYIAPAELDRAMDRFVAWHRRAPGEKATFMTARMERYFRSLAGAGTTAGWLRQGELALDGRPLAMLFAVEEDGVLSAYNSAIEPDALALSPGVLLHAYAIRDAIARRLRTYDLLRGDERYKYDLGGHDVVLWRLAARRSD